MKSLTLISLTLLIISCNPTSSQETAASPPSGFNDYWYGGEAEITSYELQQARYGEIHSGKAVLVFVTEPFSKSKQVKLDDWRDQSADNVSVMKLNLTKKFITGIYPYSMMMSTFTPVSADKYPNPIKVTTSSQEWCGHTFMQLNRGKSGYRLRGYSYFESEGDVDVSVKDAVLEDELWTRIRLNPASLPTGKVNLHPSTFYLRLRHKEAKPLTAECTLTSMKESEYASSPHQVYSIVYDNRKLAIYFEEAFPYGILGWEETYLSGFGEPQELTTKAKKINSIKSAYWGKNSNKDREIRKELGLGTEY